MIGVLLDIKLGDRQVRPTENQQHLAAAGAAGLVLGLVLDSRWMKLGGALGLAGAAWSVWQDVALTVQPEAMNAHFLTGGKVSALNPVETTATVLAGLRSSSRSYGPRRRSRTS